MKCFQVWNRKWMESWVYDLSWVASWDQISSFHVVLRQLKVTLPHRWLRPLVSTLQNALVHMNLLFISSWGSSLLLWAHVWLFFTDQISVLFFHTFQKGDTGPESTHYFNVVETSYVSQSGCAGLISHQCLFLRLINTCYFQYLKFKPLWQVLICLILMITKVSI